MSIRHTSAATAVLVALLAVGGAGCSATPTSSRSAGPTASSVPKQTAPSTASDTTRLPATTVANPWSAYWTSVNPGGAIDFVTAQMGWRLDGQLFGPRLDDNLGAGAADNGSAWPGTSITETTDGGTTWSTILRVGSGIWGMDLLSRDVGFAVGVTSLRRTTDGGEHWQQVSEPAGHPLVWVDFKTSELGYGLTTIGTLVRTVDGGSRWNSTGMTTTGTAACFASAQVGYVSDRSGDLYATHDDGRSWAEVERAPSRPEQFVGPWSDLSCNGTNIWLGLQLLCAAACGATFPYLVAHSANGGTSWSTMASDWPAASVATAPVAFLAAVAVGPSSRGLIVNLPIEYSSPPTNLRLLVAEGSGTTYTTATVPALPTSSSAALDVHICGVTFVGSTGWLYFHDRAVGLPGKPRAEPVLWKTTDGGSSWEVLVAGPSQPPPPVG
jgi:photosystem II stability/assembly factor-like uncharacterized protein